MADLKISELGALAANDLVAADELAIVDNSASETKKITVSSLIAKGVTLISDDAIPGAKILFGASDIATAALADSAVTAAKIANDAVTAAKIADNVIVSLASTLPTSGGYIGQLALDTDDNNVYVWNGSAWLSIKAPGSVNAFTNTTAGVINISTAVSSGTATITASIDDTTSAAQFLAGPVGSAGTVGYRTIDGGDLPTATTTSKGGVIVNGGGLTLSTDTIQIANSVSASSVNHLVQYDANGLITAGSTIGSSDLPVATSSAKGAVFIGSGGGLTVNASGNLSVDNTVTSGTYTKVTVTAKGLVSAGAALTDADIPNHSAAKLTSGTIGTSLIASDSITAAKLADQSTTKFGGAAGSDNVTIFPSGDFQGQFFYDETTQDLYIFTGSAFVPITVLSGNLVNAGAYNANTNQMSSVTSAGSAVGFAVGNALPAPAVTNLNHYVVVDTSGTGSGAAPAVALAPPDMLLSQGVGTEYSLIDVSNAIAGQTASNISLIATGDITATNVQTGITELDQEKLPKAGGTMTGNLNLGTSTNVVFEGSSADDYETTLTVTNPTADRTISLPNVTGTVVTTGDTGSVTSTMILDGTINNGDINANAEIAVSKLANGTARQLLQTDSGGSGVEFTSNVNIPGTLDVTNTAVFDSNVGIGTSSPGAALDISRTSANAELHLESAGGSGKNYLMRSLTNGNFALGNSATNHLLLSGDNALLCSAAGRTGIGTTVPASPLHVVGTSGSPALSLTGGSTTSSVTQVNAVDEGATVWNQLDLRAYSIQFDIQGTQKMQLDSLGNLNIGTTSNLLPSSTRSTVSVNNTGSSALALGVNGTRKGHLFVSSSSLELSATSNGMIFTAGDLERMRINSAGNVGIGATNPLRPLTISKAGAEGLEIGPGESSNLNLSLHFNRSSNVYVVNEQRASAHTFFIQGNEKARIDSSGNIDVGSPASNSFTSGARISSGGKIASYVGSSTTGTDQRIYVYNGSTASYAATINADGTSEFTGAMTIRRPSTSGVGIQIYASSAEKISLKADGSAVFSGSVTASNVSDIRFKENITDARPQLADAVALGSQLKNFDWNDDAPLNDEQRAKRFLGLVAQEAEKVCPGLTYTVPRTKQGAELTPETTDEEGNVTPATYEELDDSYKAINHDVLVMKLLGAVAELSAKVAALEAG